MTNKQMPEWPEPDAVGRVSNRELYEAAMARLRVAMSELERISFEGHDESRLYKVRMAIGPLPPSTEEKRGQPTEPHPIAHGNEYGLHQNHRMYCIRANTFQKVKKCICDCEERTEPEKAGW